MFFTRYLIFTALTYVKAFPVSYALRKLFQQEPQHGFILVTAALLSYGLGNLAFLIFKSHAIIYNPFGRCALEDIDDYAWFPSY
jgi:uncharacterized BrkB/YihY/UPF0761 family membrane protein